MDEPTVQYFVERENKWREAEQWPLLDTQWKEFYLLPRICSVINQSLLLQTLHRQLTFVKHHLLYFKTESVKWKSGKFLDDIEMSGHGALYVLVAIDTDDTNLIAKIYDIDPNGKRKFVTSGYLKASHRELDNTKSEPGKPHHPHTRSVPVPPGRLSSTPFIFTYFQIYSKLGTDLSSNLVLTKRSTMKIHSYFRWSAITYQVDLLHHLKSTEMRPILNG
ncbi:CocE/NonD family hydrolase C-terminal non-catalytic domain-containing protein [Alkalihalobacterium alkalinitrilicum]|uniref:CocE/NonD family hydrolase C-terminal non-catalytic domain-containing protein n=1 Tax=Alkalihalobacterium alkalinitrilicum TaxID=427920 RepID=UPI000995A87A